MFAARPVFFTPGFVPTFASRANGRKNPPNTATGLLFCLLISLPTLTMAEDAVSDATATANNTATPVAAPPVAKTTQESDNSDKPQGRVARAIFTSAIVDREPVDNLTTVSNDTNRVFFFSDLRGLAGQIVKHRWEYNNEVMAEVTFKVGDGARWRVYSSKNLLPEWTGKWTVVVSNESGQPLKASIFEYTTATTTESAETVSR